MSGREGREEVIFCRADGAFRTVGAVVVRGNVLGTHWGAPGLKKRLQVGGGLVIEDQKYDGVVAVLEKIQSPLKCGHVGARAPTLHGLQLNVTLAIGDEDVVIPPTGVEASSTGNGGSRAQS